MMDTALVSFSLWLSLFLVVSNAKEIITVGENQGGWTLGVKYEPINAVIGDQLVRRIRSFGCSIRIHALVGSFLRFHELTFILFYFNLVTYCRTSNTNLEYTMCGYYLHRNAISMLLVRN
jgi:hypothetical protein